MAESDPAIAADADEPNFDLQSERPETHAFIQWKGTDVCMDFRCECGGTCHFDGYFAYVIECPHCDRQWEMPSILFPRANQRDPAHGCVQRPTIDDEDASPTSPTPPA